MKIHQTLIDFILKEWLAVASGAGLLLTSIYVKHFPVYSGQEIQVLFILFFLFIVVNGLQQSGLILQVARRIERGKMIPLKLVMTTFLISMIVTNDVSLIVMVPLTLSLTVNRKDVIVILEALAANAGSALSPIGNPQNLFIYWYYKIEPLAFIRTIAPFTLFFFFILIGLSLFLKTKKGVAINNENVKISGKAYIYSAFLFFVLLTVLRVFPIEAGVVVLFYALIFDRKALSIDYALLLVFFFFFGLTDNLKFILSSQISNSGHIFLFSAMASQFMSNVPAALTFAKFTPNWEALLWGVNAGGFGSLFGSLANLIAYKIYVSHNGEKNISSFLLKFLIFGYAAFLLSIGFYFLYGNGF